jgi:hypothetical protein
LGKKRPTGEVGHREEELLLGQFTFLVVHASGDKITGASLESFRDKLMRIAS